MTTLSQNIIATPRTKSGPVTLTIRVTATGPTDGVVAVLRDVTEGVARLPRLKGAEADPPELLFGSDADLDRLEWEGTDATRTPRE